MPDTEDAATRLMMARFALRPVQAQAKSAVMQTESSWIEFLSPAGCSPLHQSASKQEAYIKVGICFSLKLKGRGCEGLQTNAGELILVAYK